MKTNLKIINVTSSDIEENSLEKWIPLDSSDIYINVYIEISALDMDTHSEFTFCIATPKGLLSFANEFEEPLLMSDRNLLVYRRYNWLQLEFDLERILKECSAPTWDESVIRLQRYFKWEYETRYDEAIDNAAQ